MATKQKNNEKAEWINNITREQEGLTQNDTKKNIKLENTTL